jgi:hypothetical protein
MSDEQSNRLFIRVYFDEDVSAQVAKLVRARGFTVLTTFEAQRASTTDFDQLEFATAEQMALLTHNRVDFSGWPFNTRKTEETTPELFWHGAGSPTSWRAESWRISSDTSENRQFTAASGEKSGTTFSRGRSTRPPRALSAE